MEFYSHEYIFIMWDKHYSKYSTFQEHLGHYFTKRINGQYTMIKIEVTV